MHSPNMEFAPGQFQGKTSKWDILWKMTVTLGKDQELWIRLMGGGMHIMRRKRHSYSQAAERKGDMEIEGTWNVT